MRPRATRDTKAARVRVTLVRSWIGYNTRQEQVVRGLGLRRIGQSVELVDNPSTRGMIRQVRHLVTVG